LVQFEKEHLYELEHLFSQSAKGIHLLFDNGTIAEILREPTDSDDFFTPANVTKVQAVLTEFVEQKSLAQKQIFLRQLPSETFELLVRTYFNIVENSIFEATDVRH
jgi:hypothetical protein